MGEIWNIHVKNQLICQHTESQGRFLYLKLPLFGLYPLSHLMRLEIFQQNEFAHVIFIWRALNWIISRSTTILLNILFFLDFKQPNCTIKVKGYYVPCFFRFLQNMWNVARKPTYFFFSDILLYLRDINI